MNYCASEASGLNIVLKAAHSTCMPYAPVSTVQMVKDQQLKLLMKQLSFTLGFTGEPSLAIGVLVSFSVEIFHLR